MTIKLYHEPELESPDLIVGWPGIGNIGIIAVDTLRGQLRAEEFAEIEPWDFFYPRKVSIKNGLLESLEFPTSKFYYQRLGHRDVIFFIGEEQPTEGEEAYSKGEKAYGMASLVLDLGLRFGCRRIYTSGACVSPIHHKMKPRVCAAASSKDLAGEIKEYSNTILMSEIREGEGEGFISGLNGLLPAMAKKRGLESACIMGEIPDWLARLPQPYPRASGSVLEFFAEMLGVRIDFGVLDHMSAKVEEAIERIYERFPQEMKERYERRRAITEEEAEWIKEHIDELFKGGGSEGG